MVAPSQLAILCHSFSPNGTVTMKKDVTAANPGQYSLRITVHFTLTFSNGSLYNGRLYQYIRLNILGEFKEDATVTELCREGEERVEAFKW